MGKVARVTGLEPATSGVTGRRSNQLSYTRALGEARQLREGAGAVNNRLAGPFELAVDCLAQPVKSS